MASGKSQRGKVLGPPIVAKIEPWELETHNVLYDTLRIGANAGTVNADIHKALNAWLYPRRLRRLSVHAPKRLRVCYYI